MFYIIILLCIALIILFNTLFAIPVFGFGFWDIVIKTVCSVIAVVAIDGITAFIVRWLLPEKWFKTRNEVFVAHKNEQLFLDKIGIKKWKDHIPELGFFTAFRKNKISDPKNNQYVERYIMEANYGVTVHFASVLLGFAVIFIYPIKECLCFGIPVAVVNAICNLSSFAILRYNLPKLHRLYAINEKVAARKLSREEKNRAENYKEAAATCE